MPYNSFMPNYSYNYTNPYYLPQTPLQTPPQTHQAPLQAQNDFIWVQGESGAKAYLVAPGATVTLWDSESPTIYIKSADGRGIPSMRVLDFTERTVSAPSAPNSTPAAKEDTSTLTTQINELQAKYDTLAQKIIDLESKTKKEKDVE